MKISDELRRLAHDEGVYGDACVGLRYLADRIDAEMVELPKSADEKIWTGREVCFWTGATEGDRHEFNSLAYINDRWCVEDNDFERYPAVSVWYERPDSWERIADELDEMVCTADAADDDCEKLADLAERIRKLAKEEGER